MPTYTYRCNHCKIVFDTFQTVAKYTGKCKCPKCKKISKERDYQIDLPDGFVRLGTSQIRTLGHLAQRNAESMSSDQKAEMTRQFNAYKDTEPTKDLPHGMSRMRKNGKVEFTPNAEPSKRKKKKEVIK